MIVKSISTQVRTSPKKAQEVAALLRGQKVDDAITILEHTPRRAAKYIANVVSSAKANAINNHNLNDKGLMISSVQIGSAGSLKRWRPAARGRVLTYKHKLSRITVYLEGSEVKNTKMEKPAGNKNNSAKISSAKEID